MDDYRSDSPAPDSDPERPLTEPDPAVFEPLLETPANGCFHLPAIVDPLEPAEPDTAFVRTRALRHDGWTPAKQRLFLERFAECGVITEACRGVGLSARSAYNLRDRDPFFAAGWEAATIKARPRLADEVFSRSMTGVVERIYKDGVIVAERHRHDNKLAMAVLARLDARADKAAAENAPCLDLAAQWDVFLAALGEDRRADIAALLAPDSGPAKNAPDCELHELHQHEDAEDDAHDHDRHTVWEDDEGFWTDYPPPADFDGEERGAYGDYQYRRSLSSAEQAVIDGDQARDHAEAEAQRDAYFGLSAAPPAAPEA